MFKKRLVAAIVSIFAIGVVFGIFLCENGALSFCALFAALSFVSAIVVSFFFKNKSIIASKRVKAVALAVAAFSFGILRIYAFDFCMDSYERYNKKEDTALLQISEINASYVDVKVLSSEIGVPNGTNVRFYNADISNNAIVGDQLKANVTYKQAYKRNLYLTVLVFRLRERFCSKTKEVDSFIT